MSETAKMLHVNLAPGEAGPLRHRPRGIRTGAS